MKLKIKQLSTYLDDEQSSLVEIAIKHQIPILIKGIHAPTGKSTLCYAIREIGGTVVEEWETEEGTDEQKNLVECPIGENKCHVVITLNKILEDWVNG